MKRKILIFITKGSEDIEVVVPYDVWKRAGFDVKTMSIDSSKDIVLGRGTSVKTDYLLNDTSLSNFNTFYIPGGAVMDSFLSRKADMLKSYFVKNANNPNITFIALCAAPSIYATWGLYNNTNNNNRKILTMNKTSGLLSEKTVNSLKKFYTCYPGFETNFLENYISDSKVVIDENLITGNGPGSAFNLAYSLVEITNGQKVKIELQSEMQY